jgi:hypothetical protein
MGTVFGFEDFFKLSLQCFSEVKRVQRFVLFPELCFVSGETSGDSGTRWYNDIFQKIV